MITILSRLRSRGGTLCGLARRLLRMVVELGIGDRIGGLEFVVGSGRC